MSCERRAAAAMDTPAVPVDVVPDELDGRETASVVDLDHASLPRQAYDSINRQEMAEGHAAAQRRSSGCCRKWRTSVLLNDFEF